MVTLGIVCSVAVGAAVGYFVGTNWDSLVCIKNKVCEAITQEFGKKGE